MSKKIKYIFLAILLIFFIQWIISLLKYNNMCLDANYYNSIEVITRNYDDKINYYEINYSGCKRKIDKFQPDSMHKYTLLNCYDSFKNQILNEVQDDCLIIDEKNNEKIKLDDSNLKDIVYEISKINHDIVDAKIIKVNDKYFPVVSLNVNWWSPYELYYYENNKLIKIVTFDDEDIIGIKENTFFGRK